MNRVLLLAVTALVLPAGLLACSGASPTEPTPTPTPTAAVRSVGPRKVEAGAPAGSQTSVPPVHEAKVVYVGASDRPAVALTFDTGVDAGHMPEVLDTLKKHGIPSTFGITGEWAVTNPDLLKRIVAEGHAIVNHSWGHPSFTGEDTETPPLSDKQIRDEFRRTEDKIQKIAGVSTKPYFRPPYGDYDSRVNRIAFEEGYEYNVLWYVDGLGWEGRSTKYAINVTLENAFNGAIYLYHTDNLTEYKALDEIIDGLVERGFQLLTVPQLLGKQPIPSPTPTPTPTPTATPTPTDVSVRRLALGATPRPTPPPLPPPSPTPPPTHSPTPTPIPVYTRLAFDDFESADAAGGSGWLGSWQSTASFATSGETPHSGNWQQDLSSGAFVYRAGDVAGQTGVHLRFWSRFSRAAPSHRAIIMVNHPDSLSWLIVGELSAADADGAYHLYDIDLSGIDMSTGIVVGFYGLLDPATDVWHIDDVELVKAEP